MQHEIVVKRRGKNKTQSKAQKQKMKIKPKVKCKKHYNGWDDHDTDGA